MKRLFVAALSLVILAATSACVDSINPGASLAGIYTLRTVNGQTPPVTIVNNSTLREDVLMGRIILDANGNYTGITRYQDTYTGQQPGAPYDDQIDGYWSLSGNQIALTDHLYPNNPYVGTVQNGTITLSDFSTGVQFTLVYSK